MVNKTLTIILLCTIVNCLAIAQGPLCSQLDPFCTDAGATFPAGVDAGDAEEGNEYDCLGTQPNPAWYFLQIEDPGEITIDMTNSNYVDIDFILYGPFNNLGDALYECGSYGQDDVVDCSYSAISSEIGVIPDAQMGEVYVLLITNYSNQPTEIYAVSYSTSIGTTNCDIILDCFINEGTLVNEVCSDQTGSINDMVITGGDGNYTYEWLDANGDFVSSDIDINNLSEGIYTFTVTDISGCETSQDFTIENIIQEPDVSFQYASTQFCIEENNPAAINVATPGGTFSSNGLTVNATTGEIDLQSGMVNNSYYIYYELIGNCSSIDSFEVSITEAPSAAFSFTETDYCQGDPSPMPTATNTGGVYSINGGLNINPVSGEIDLSTAVPGNSYDITYSLIGSCPESSMQTINILPEPEASFSVVQMACAGDEVQVEFNGSGDLSANNFNWTFDQAQVLSGSGEGPYTLQYSSLGTYDIDLALVDLACSTSNYSQQIEIINLELTTESELAINYGQSIDLTTAINSSNNLNYTWSPANFLSCTNCPSPIASPIETSTYNVAVVDNSSGCTTTASIYIEVTYAEPYVPNVFTPNEDSVNDEFKPEGEVIGDAEFAIFNRNGERVFYSTDLSQGWNGTFNDKKLNSDVFVWTLHYTLPNGLDRLQKGNVTLIR